MLTAALSFITWSHRWADEVGTPLGSQLVLTDPGFQPNFPYSNPRNPAYSTALGWTPKLGIWDYGTEKCLMTYLGVNLKMNFSLSSFNKKENITWNPLSPFTFKPKLEEGSCIGKSPVHPPLTSAKQGSLDNTLTIHAPHHKPSPPPLLGPQAPSVGVDYSSSRRKPYS